MQDQPAAVASICVDHQQLESESVALIKMEYGYVYPYYPPYESAHTAVRGQFSTAQSVTNTTDHTVSTHMEQSLQHAQLGSGITLVISHLQLVSRSTFLDQLTL